MTRYHLIGQSLPRKFSEFIELLSVIGSQIERLGFYDIRSYLFGQTGTFVDGTGGVAGGKLLGGILNGDLSTPTFTSTSMILPNSNMAFKAKSAGGDIQMTRADKIE